MPRRVQVAVLCWAMASACPGDEVTDAALAEDAGQMEETAAGQGMVIELDETAPAETAPEAEQGPGAGFRQGKLADSEVELIVGGEGKDGIAKRSRLKKED